VRLGDLALVELDRRAVDVRRERVHHVAPAGAALHDRAQRDRPLRAQPDLLGDLAQRGVLRRLALVDEPARQIPLGAAAVGVAHEQHVVAAAHDDLDARRPRPADVPPALEREVPGPEQAPARWHRQAGGDGLCALEQAHALKRGSFVQPSARCRV
jgi:hypothetical protein